MKSYDDLQRFKEKTHTQDIHFKDMSEQTLASDNTHWAIIKQLLQNETGDSVLDRGQSVDRVTPQPIQKDAFVAPPVASPLVGEPPAPGVKSSLLDSVATTLKSAVSLSLNEVKQPDTIMSALITPPVNAASEPLPLLQQAAQHIHPEPSPSTSERYKPLFRARGVTAIVSKETLLKSLLEKIALCH